MSSSPFRDTARKIARNKDYYSMAWESDRARSHGWWKNLIEYGAWQGPPGGGRVGPPDPEALDGIAKLFGTTTERVSAMIAADWYGVRPDTDLSARVLSLGPVLDRLTDSDAELVEDLARRLAQPNA
ncbi:hypothetical protein [Actinoallomurus rhizosphaericola]|uniref:hypothetical protein n=1 Tax=Actinoallomurus rhizosphaericola TaxID=2952536 RepID=UPI00209162C6|nr:hypothetical protein [Actinoallomurus rhizosphaericola]MCO5994767.1 hypothetical protein [Actinoallomurus rhizosphaericola]